MEQKRNSVGWLDIPVVDMERAVAFYGAVFQIQFERHQMGPMDMAWFPYGDLPGSPGALVFHKEFSSPSTNGVLIYFTSPSGDLSQELARVDTAGGKVLQQKRLITQDIGYMGILIDSEGNRIAIHSRK